jgi:hypothetical protein
MSKAALGDLALLWLFGICLRITVLAVPPVIPLMHESFALSQAAIGALTSLRGSRGAGPMQGSMQGSDPGQTRDRPGTDHLFRFEEPWFLYTEQVVCPRFYQRSIIGV